MTLQLTRRHVGTEAVTVRPVRTRRQWRAFEKVPFTVYRSDPHWVPGEIASVKDMLRTPSPETRGRMTTQAFLSYRGAVVTGRIVAIADLVFIAHYDQPTAYFGFYECVDDDESAHALLDAAAAWARARSLTTLMGPLSPSLLWNAGVLVAGNDIPPLIGMPHHPSYYAEQLEKWGLRSVKEFHSFYHDDPHTLVQTPLFDRKRTLAARWRSRSSVVIRPLDMTRFDEDIDRVRILYNKAFQSFWGFTPVEPDELAALVEPMKPIIDPDIMLFAELDGEVVGFVLGIPDINRAAVHSVRSRFAIARDLHTIARWRGPRGAALRKHVRLDMMFVDPDCPDRGTSAMLIFELFERIHNGGYDSVEAAPVLADGGWFHAVRSSYPVDPLRTYRIYSRELG